MSRSKHDAAGREPALETRDGQAAPGSMTPSEPTATVDRSETASAFASLLEAPSRGLPVPTLPFVASCTEVKHPSLHGRVKIRRERSADADAGDRERWVPVLHGLSIRVGDRLFVQHVDGHPDPIVIGVIDGFLPRPAPPPEPGPRLVLQRDESVRVESPDGDALLEILQNEHGPIVRLLAGATQLELPGKLTITAAELELRASSGSARIEATDEVRLTGEVIHLN
jgi:hypothetical protein